MNYDSKRRKFFVVLKYIGSLNLKNPSSKCCESEERQLESNDPKEFSANPTENEDSFERTEHEEIFRGQRDCEHCYMVELVDSRGIQSVRLAHTALNKEDALDLAVKSGRCLSIDFSLLNQLLEPGNGQFTIKITISRIQSNVEDSKTSLLEKTLIQTNVSEDSAVT